MSTLVKYPRTRHAVWSRTVGEDDKVHRTMDHFQGREVVVTEKLDGENTTFMRDHYHARSPDSRHHPSRDAVKQIWGNIRHMIPDNWRVCGENMYAKHSVEYTDLPSYFMAFSVWDETNTKLSYDDGVAFVQQLGLTPVPELWRGVYDEKIIKSLWTEADYERMEGYVIQVVDAIPYDDFGTFVAKYVRPKHVQTSEHWMNQQLVPNRLKR